MKITPIAAAVILPAVAAGAAFGAVPLARAAPAAPASPAAHAAAQHAARVTAKRPAPSAVHHYRHQAQHKAAVVAGHSQAATSATAGSQSAASSAQAQQPAAVSGGSLTGGMSSFEQCVAWRESGDTPTDPDGLFGILPSTWAQLGYSGTAGQASVGQQEVAFQRLYAEYGAQPWAPSDGC
jgi:hypothetical protein